MTALAAFALAGCLTVDPSADQIRARDLVPALPSLGSVPPESPVAPAPAAGVQRVFRIPELRLIASRFNAPGEPIGEICFARRTAPLDATSLLEAMRRTLPHARIEIVDCSRWPVPDGELEFPAGGLRPASGGALWTGWVLYGGTQRFHIWAKVKISVRLPRVIAVEDLEPGRPLDSGRIRLELQEGFPDAEAFAASVEEVAGKALRRRVRAGQPIRRIWLETPKDVRRGDILRVEVRRGGARLELEAAAETSASVGQTVWVLNPATKRRFAARVEGRGRASAGEGTL